MAYPLPIPPLYMCINLILIGEFTQVAISNGAGPEDSPKASEALVFGCLQFVDYGDSDSPGF